MIYVDKRYNNGVPFVIKTINNSKENIYIQSATLNGKPLKKAKLSFFDVVKGGELVLTLGNTPNYDWGK